MQFKTRYHPDENYKRREEQTKNVVQRLEVFLDLMEKGWLNDLSLDLDKSKEITRFLDACVIRLEGGTDEDITRLLDSNSKPDVKEVIETNGDDSSTKQDNDEKTDENEENGDEKKPDDSGSESGAYTDSDSDGEEKTRKKKSRNSKPSIKPPVQLHKTSSIFMRNLAPSVTKSDLENLCKQYDGFKRVALSDPAPERGFYRRGWITFDSNVDVKKICWNLQNIKIKDSNPGAIVNRELTSRIRAVSSHYTNLKKVVKNDLKIALKIIQNMDLKWGVWQERLEKTESSDEIKEVQSEEVKDEATKAAEDYQKLEDSGFEALPIHKIELNHNFYGPNPLLENITDYLVDEANAEESELLGDEENNTQLNMMEIDHDYLKALDKLILYLRVVHSIDFYNSIEYQQEDSMPNRLGILFVRPGPSTQKLKSDEMDEYIKVFQAKMKQYVEYKDRIDLEMAKRLGLKDRRDEIEKFIKTNTQELAPDRWLCPLSGKRFKGAEFIRKHLFYKHIEKIIEVKKEVEYFNNYLMDPKRPQLPEHPTNRPGSDLKTSQSQQSQGVNYTSPGMMQPMMGGYGMRPQQQGWVGPGTWASPDMMQGYQQQQQFSPQFGYQPGGGGYQGFKKQGYQQQQQQQGGPQGFQRRREMIQYKDLDAPDEL
ncbi:unnamed protein product [Brachionus calyciflorus]|uniref:Arsenite-resistance protein 2 homolog n=1 Tax=Brachionus calyciflorus TaxID=104777 RepID=A0A813WXP2_9BILA|nr:unnamed protein product [Brachionus calyciflorus]